MCVWGGGGGRGGEGYGWKGEEEREPREASRLHDYTEAQRSGSDLSDRALRCRLNENMK